MAPETIELRKKFNKAFHAKNSHEIKEIMTPLLINKSLFIELLPDEAERHRMLISAMVVGKKPLVQLVNEHYDIFLSRNAVMKELMAQACEQYIAGDTELMLTLSQTNAGSRHLKSHMFFVGMIRDYPDCAWVLVEMVKDNTKDFGQAIHELLNFTIYNDKKEKNLDRFKDYLARWSEKIKTKRLKDCFALAITYHHGIANYLVENNLVTLEDISELLFNVKNNSLLRTLNVEGLVILDNIGLDLNLHNYEILTKKISLGHFDEMEYLLNYVYHKCPEDLPFLRDFVEMTEYKGNNHLQEQAVEMLDKLILAVKLTHNLTEKSSKIKHKI